MSWLTWLHRRLDGTLKGAPMQTKGRSRPRWARLGLEQLEDRIVPVTNIWQGGSADWAAATANWSLGHFPISTEDVQIANGTTVTHSAGSDAVLSVTIAAGNTLLLTGSSAVVVTAGAVLDGTLQIGNDTGSVGFFS